MCPGHNVTYKCTAQAYNVAWRENTPGGGVSFHSTEDVLKNETIVVGHFRIQVISRSFNQQPTIVSTATLQHTSFSHNNLSISCRRVNEIDEIAFKRTLLVSG